MNTPLGAGFLVTLSQPSNTATITNTVNCREHTHAGQAGPRRYRRAEQLDSERLIPRRPPGQPPRSRVLGASGSAAATADVTPNARYQLFETGGDPRYVQTDNRTTLQSNPLSTGSATCIRVDADGASVPGSGFSDGINGGVNVPLGYRVACTFVNQTASLTLLKNVVNDNGGRRRRAHGI